MYAGAMPMSTNSKNGRRSLLLINSLSRRSQRRRARFGEGEGECEATTSDMLFTFSGATRPIWREPDAHVVLIT